MLVLPIVNKGRVMNAELKIIGASKIREDVCYSDIGPGDIMSNRIKFSESSFKKSENDNAPLEFVLYSSLNRKRRSFLVTTEKRTDSNTYDVYEVPQPPEVVNNKNTNGFEKLFSKKIIDMQKEIPGSPKRGRYVSFEDLGMNEVLSDEKIAKLQRIVKEYPKSEWPKLFEEAGIMGITKAIEFIKCFEFTIIPDTTIPEVSLQETLTAMSSLNTRDSRNLKKYYRMAKGNANIYKRLSYANKLVNGEPLTLIRAKGNPKQLIKKKGEVIEFPRAA